MNEREISIVDLMVDILLHWRAFIIWMLIGAVALGAFSYVRSVNAVKQQEPPAETKQDPEEWLTEDEILNVTYVVDYEKAYFLEKAYRDELLILQVDPEKICKAEATIAIDGGERQRSYDIAKVYEDIMVSSELCEEVAKETGMRTVDLSEMLFLNRGGSGGDSLGVTEGVSTFRISAIHSEEAQSKKMLEAAIDFLKKKGSGVADSLGEHEVTVVNESFGTVTDMQIAERQKNSLSTIETMRRSISDMKEGLSEKEMEYYELLTEDEQEKEEETLSPVDGTPSAGISVKYVLLGAVMAAFVYAFVLLLVYIFNTKIRDTDNLQELYGLPQLGVIPGQAGKKKVLGVVDRWILTIRDHNKRQFSPEEALELSAVAAKMAAGKEGLQDICLMGCGLKDHSLDICGKLKARLEEEGLHVTILNNVLYDAQMLEELEGARGVILVESVGATLYNEIAAELELLKRQDISALGGILAG